MGRYGFILQSPQGTQVFYSSLLYHPRTVPIFLMAQCDSWCYSRYIYIPGNRVEEGMNKETECGSAAFGGKFPGSILQFVSHWPELSSKANLATSDWEMCFFFLVTLVNYFVTKKKGRMCIGGCYQPVLGGPHCLH